VKSSNVRTISLVKTERESTWVGGNSPSWALHMLVGCSLVWTDNSLYDRLVGNAPKAELHSGSFRTRVA
jgi:hypothetical protein